MTPEQMQAEFDLDDQQCEFDRWVRSGLPPMMAASIVEERWKKVYSQRIRDRKEIGEEQPNGS